MADLTPLDEKLGEVLGLAQAAQTVTEMVSKLEGAGAFRDELETKSEAGEMMKSYLGGEEEALDGFEFLSMSEAGELCHWKIVGDMAQKIGDQAAEELAEWAVRMQREHIEIVRRAALALAAEGAEALV
jgi:hypothetical protein